MIPGTRLVIIGRQGAGKGTQCVRLARHYVVPHISTGDVFRAAVKEGTELGLKAAEFIESGELIPDDIVIGVVRDRLEQDDVRRRGFVLDGFPRTAVQGEALNSELEEMKMPLDLAIDIEVPEEVVLKRLAARRVCSTCGANYSTSQPPHVNWTCDVCGGEVVQRADDTEEAIRTRLATYERQTAPLIAWYDSQNLLATIDGLGPADEVTHRMIKAVDQRRLL